MATFIRIFAKKAAANSCPFELIVKRSRYAEKANNLSLFTTSTFKVKTW
jgi:hypothetical protein